ncbi:DUF3375 domain-containing protein [Pseudarthrobacter sp. BRE9]|uniref:DUF3375 domain-containing protein n=1 Tax=Pseudarthrobacter sp. BRE9 TaxID=2962582 RepID=UPI0028817EDC|nr:DUF3375 domain-containing protein [Pseudarthrobacter sp. BRE9]MDT0169742.1 DUF3375 domain-containing protein [Pseudarthrobacter sp. BRE9]
MTVLRAALTASRLLSEDPAWRLLRTNNAAIAVAVLSKHLGGEQRRLAAPALFEHVEEDLEELRGNGFDLPQTAQAYCTAWRNEGVLIRRTAEGSREETFELSLGALQAIRFVTELSQPRQAVTESRLATILDRVRVLARETDPDSTSRLRALHEERARIDAQIERAAGGDVDVLSAEQAAERLRDVLSLIEEIPSDFARVRSELEQLNRDLRERLIEQDGPRGSVLDDIFRGVDLLAESEAGRSFSGFYALLLDPEQGRDFEDSIDTIMDRQFTSRLSAAQVRILRRILPTLQDRSSEIHAVMTAFSRSLRRFVQSQELEQDRLINQRLRSALRQALETSQSVKPYAKTELSLDLTSVPLNSVAALNLHNPADFEAAGEITEHAAETVDIEELRALARASEIDMIELTGNINAVLSRQSSATIADVLADRPATQGVASVVGLLVLAEEHAIALSGREDVTWRPPGGSGTTRRGTVGRYLFTERIHP